MDELAEAESWYTSRQRAAYLSPLCPVCGGTLIPHWLDAEATGPNRLFRLAYTFCANGCEER